MLVEPAVRKQHHGVAMVPDHCELDRPVRAARHIGVGIRAVGRVSVSLREQRVFVLVEHVIVREGHSLVQELLRFMGDCTVIKVHCARRNEVEGKECFGKIDARRVGGADGGVVSVVASG